MIRCCAKNCSSVTPVADNFLRYLQCCNTLQVFESDSKTCNSIARIRSKLVSVICCRQFLSQRWPEFSARIKEGIWGEVGPFLFSRVLRSEGEGVFQFGRISCLDVCFCGRHDCGISSRNDYKGCFASWLICTWVTICFRLRGEQSFTLRTAQ